MADPNFANVAEQIAFYYDRFDEVEKDSSPSSNSFMAYDEAALNDIQGFYAQRAREFILADQARVGAMLSRDNVAAGLAPYMRQMGVAIDSPAATDGSIDQLWQDLYDYMDTNSQTVNSREFTYASPSGSGTGSGECVRLTVDEQGYNLEGWWPDAYSIECDVDARQSGQIHEESFVANGTDATINELRRTGSGLVVNERVKALNARDSKPYVKNPSWNDYTSTAVAGAPAAPTELPGWSGYSSLSNFQIDLDITFRTSPGDTNSASLRFTTNETISQNLVTVNGTKIDPDTPYYVDVAVYRRDSCDGTLTFSLGGVSRAVTMSTLSNNAWNRVRLVSTPGANCWPLAFNANALTLTLTLASRTTGSLHVDDLIFAPWTRLGAGSDARRGRGAMGTYVVVVGGATNFVRGYAFTFTDTAGGTRGVNQYWNAVANRGYLPSNAAGAETWADK